MTTNTILYKRVAPEYKCVLIKLSVICGSGVSHKQLTTKKSHLCALWHSVSHARCELVVAASRSNMKAVDMYCSTAHSIAAAHSIAVITAILQPY